MLWSNFDQPSPNGKVHHYYRYVWMIVFVVHTVVYPSPNFKNCFMTFSKLINLNYFNFHFFTLDGNMLSGSFEDFEDYFRDLIEKRCDSN